MNNLTDFIKAINLNIGTEFLLMELCFPYLNEWPRNVPSVTIPCQVISNE